METNKRPPEYLQLLRDRFIRQLWKNDEKNYSLQDIADLFNSKLSKSRIEQIIKQR